MFFVFEFEFTVFAFENSTTVLILNTEYDISATLKSVHTVFNSMCQFFFYLIHKIDWDFTWIMIQSWSIHVGTSQLWGSLRPFLNGLINV